MGRFCPKSTEWGRSRAVKSEGRLENQGHLYLDNSISNYMLSCNCLGNGIRNTNLGMGVINFGINEEKELGVSCLLGGSLGR